MLCGEWWSVLWGESLQRHQSWKVRGRTEGTVGRRGGLRKEVVGFPGGAVDKNPPANAGDAGSIPGLGRSHMPRSN